MKLLSLNAEIREVVGKGPVKRLRKTGVVPGVVYGGGEEPVNLVFNGQDLKLFLHKSGEHGIVQLKVGEKAPIMTVLSEIQHHPVSDAILHIDFTQIPKDKPVEIKVPIEFVGTAPGVADGGMFMPRLHELDIITLPSNVPDVISVDISHLDFDHVLHVKDIVFPEGVEVVHEPMQTVATVIRPRGLEVTASAEEIETPEEA